LAAATSSLGFAGMHADERLGEFPDHVPERQLQRRPAPNQDIIVAAAQVSGAGEPHQFAQPPPDAVAFHGIADLPRHCEADTHAVFVDAPLRLQYERIAGGPHSGSGSAKIRSALQPIHVENNA
jgi:hypothetical protein